MSNEHDEQNPGKSHKPPRQSAQGSGLRTLSEAEWRAETEGALILVSVPEGPLLRGAHVYDDEVIARELNEARVGNEEADRNEAAKR